MVNGVGSNDPGAERLWRQCRTDRDLRWLLEGILGSRNQELGRCLLIHPAEVFGEVQARVGARLSLLYRLTGFPYLTGEYRDLLQSLKRIVRKQSKRRLTGGAESNVEEWVAANGAQGRNILAAAVLETVRRNTPMCELVASTQPISANLVAQQIRDFDALDWSAAEEAIRLFEPFLARSPSKKILNRFTLNFPALIGGLRPELTQPQLVVHSANHFLKLMANRKVEETAWRSLLLNLRNRGLIEPYMAMFMWCKREPELGFVAPSSFSIGDLPPYCPACGRDAHALASFAPAALFRDAMNLKDGLLGAAIGWQLRKRKISFRHGEEVHGTEMDFLLRLQRGWCLIECKTLFVGVPEKQLIRNLREAKQQLDTHVSHLNAHGWPVRDAISVVNVTPERLESLFKKSRGLRSKALLSYAQFTSWLRKQE